MIPAKIKILKLIDKNNELDETKILNSLKGNYSKNRTFILQLDKDGFIKQRCSKYVLTSLGYEAIFTNFERIYNKTITLISLIFSAISLAISILIFFK